MRSRHPQFIDWNAVCYNNFVGMYQEVVARQDFCGLKNELKALFEGITWQQCQWNSVPKRDGDTWLAVRVLVNHYSVGVHRDVLEQADSFAQVGYGSATNEFTRTVKPYNPDVNYLDIVNKTSDVLVQIQLIEDRLRGAIALVTEELTRCKDKIQDFISCNRDRVDEIESFIEEKNADDSASVSMRFSSDGAVFSGTRYQGSVLISPPTPLLSCFRLLDDYGEFTSEDGNKLREMMSKLMSDALSR